MEPTPSWLRASSMDVSQSGLSGAMLAEGLEGGRMPAADAGALVSPAATVLMTMAPMGSRSVAMRRRALRCTLCFPLFACSSFTSRYRNELAEPNGSF